MLHPILDFSSVNVVLALSGETFAYYVRHSSDLSRNIHFGLWFYCCEDQAKMVPW
jgi:hypothetical protein